MIVKCLHIHSCDDGTSSFPLGTNPVSIPDEGPLHLRATFHNADLQFSYSLDGATTFQDIGPVLDASLLSDDHGEHWGFTGTFVALACQDLTGSAHPATFSFLDLKTQNPSA